MARFNFDPVPTVAPTGAPGNDYENIPTSPAMFGGAIAGAEEKLGQGVEATAQAGFNIRDFYGKVATDDTINNVMTQADIIRKGDPNKTVVGPDGKPRPDTGFMGLQGRDALDARQPAMDRLDQAIEEGRKNLPTDKDRLEYDMQTRRLRSYWANEIGTHADTQFKVWSQGVNNSAAGHALNHIASNADNDIEVKHATEDLINFRVQEAQVKFGDDPTVKDHAIEAAKAEALQQRAEAISVKDPKRALDLVDKNKEPLGVRYQPLADRLRARADQQLGLEGGQRAISASAGAPPPTAVAGRPIAGVPVSYLSSIQREEGFDPVPKWDVKQWTVGYGTRASGPNERPNKTELDQRFQSEIGKAAKIVDGVNPNLDPGTRAALTSLTYNTGDDWTHAGLGEKIRAGDLDGAKPLFLQYGNVAGQPNAAVTGRRWREAQWFGQADAPAQPAGNASSLKSSAYQVAMSDPDL